LVYYLTNTTYYFLCTKAKCSCAIAWVNKGATDVVVAATCAFVTWHRDVGVK